MQCRRRSVLIPVMAGIGGLVLGASIALLVLHRAASEWVEAAGTWVGAVGTVFALLWAVRTFRADQADREHSRKLASAERDRQAQDREQSIQDEAALVTIRVRGAVASGSDSDLTMEWVKVTIANDTTIPVRVHQVSLGGPLVRRSAIPSDIRLEHAEVKPFQVAVEPIPTSPEEMNRDSVQRFEANMTYALGGRVWTTTSAEGARPKGADV